MSLIRQRPRLQIRSHGPKQRKTEQLVKDLTLTGGCLTPEIQLTKPQFPAKPKAENQGKVYKIGRFLLEHTEGETYKACDCTTGEEKICKEFQIHKYRESLSAYWLVDAHENISSISEIILGETKAYVFFDCHYGDLHSYVRQKKKLKEDEAANLFRQIVAAVKHCHDSGVILRDLKLRKFVFKNKERTELRLDSLEDACILEQEDDDRLSDKHGCPAYVSPEILNHNTPTYSGRAADIWSLGVMLYTILVGRYPFHDAEPTILFSKIRRGQYLLPPSLSSKVKCLLKSVLRQEPDLRLSAEECLSHPWLNQGSRSNGFVTISNKFNDQTVPEVVLDTFEHDFFT
ncbi:TRIB2-like protein [Mya arenaria]|uniref:TRIB2-like protein n=1 Tax=Mya arenaria TaxID=6604 RepID=A0ABY7F8A1_MYAAR|nr:tribbles homolog 2-like [Mya arenaria]WAR17236.1 TRIB2-like protein [Mya arenaria]